MCAWLDCIRNAIHLLDAQVFTISFTAIASNSHLEWSQPSILRRMECTNTALLLSAPVSSEWANEQSNYNFMLAKNYNIAAFLQHSLALGFSLTLAPIKFGISATIFGNGSAFTYLNWCAGGQLMASNSLHLNLDALHSAHAMNPLPKKHWMASEHQMRCVREIFSSFVFHLA